MKVYKSDYNDVLSEINGKVSDECYSRICSLVNDNVKLSRECFGLRQSICNLQLKLLKFSNLRG